MLRSHKRNRIMFDGAEKLMGKGDMLYQTEKDVNPIRLQAGLIEEKEINNIVYSLMQNQF